MGLKVAEDHPGTRRRESDSVSSCRAGSVVRRGGNGSHFYGNFMASRKFFLSVTPPTLEASLGPRKFPAGFNPPSEAFIL